jgi:hypothetical protein
MTKEQVLGFQPEARLEQVNDEHPEQMQGCKHRIPSTLRRESEPDGDAPQNLVFFAPPPESDSDFRSTPKIK